MAVYRLSRLWVAVVVVFSVALVIAACGDSDEETPAATSTVAPPTNGVTSTPEALPTVDPDAPLVEYESPEKGYSIDHPQGWEYRAGTGEKSDYFVQGTPEGRVFAQLSVTCETEAEVVPYDLTPDGLILRDAANVTPLGGEIDSRTAEPVQVGGVEGKTLRYSVSLSGLTIEHVVAYAVVGECGWRIGLNSFGTGTLDPYVPLFDRILESFRAL